MPRTCNAMYPVVHRYTSSWLTTSGRTSLPSCGFVRYIHTWCLPVCLFVCFFSLFKFYRLKHVAESNDFVIIYFTSTSTIHFLHLKESPKALIKMIWGYEWKKSSFCYYCLSDLSRPKMFTSFFHELFSLQFTRKQFSIENYLSNKIKFLKPVGKIYT